MSLMFHGRPIVNRLLAALSTQEAGRLLKIAQSVELKSGETLYRTETPIRHVYFPDSGVISIAAATAEGETVDVAMVGADGIVGLPIFLQSSSMPYQAIVQVPGSAIRLPASVLKQEAARCGQLHQHLLRYTYTLLMQIAQSGVCNQFHNLSQRLSARLLTIHELTGLATFPLTQETMSQMLGAQRPSVSSAAAVLQQDGAISYKRGLIRIINCRKLAKSSCECASAFALPPREAHSVNHLL